MNLNFVYCDWETFYHKQGSEIVCPKLIHCAKCYMNEVKKNETKKMLLPNLDENKIIDKMIEDFVETLHEKYLVRCFKVKVTESNCLRFCYFNFETS